MSSICRNGRSVISSAKRERDPWRKHQIAALSDKNHTPGASSCCTECRESSCFLDSKIRVVADADPVSLVYQANALTFQRHLRSANLASSLLPQIVSPIA